MCRQKGSLGETLREVRPTSFLGVPRVWEKMQERMKEIGAKTTGLRKKVADWAKGLGLEASRNEMNRYVEMSTKCAILVIIALFHY